MSLGMASSPDTRNQDGAYKDSVNDRKQNRCLKCSTSGEMLVCNVKGCPVTLHEKCLTSKPRFDELGQFYCPYCWYRRVHGKFKEIAEKAELAKSRDILNSHKRVVPQEDSAEENDRDATRREVSKSFAEAPSQGPQDTGIPTSSKGTTLREKKSTKVPWTHDEVEMLKKSVELYANKKNKPWRKMLVLGKGVYHPSRQPADLKDKWRRINRAPKTKASENQRGS